MKRLVSLLLVFSMLLTFVPVTVFAAPTASEAVEVANPFTDVKESDWFYDAVRYVRINGFFNGTSETTFTPNGTMTRGMFVTVLGRMAGVDTANYAGQAPFKDVPANMYYAPYVAWAAKHGITSGMGDGTFAPDGLINREQMAAFFVRYFENFNVDYETGENITTTPADLNQVSSWAQDAVAKLWKQGLLNGDGTNFNPAADATRAQTATIAYRTDEAVKVWYKEPGVPSDRVKMNSEPDTEEDEGTKYLGTNGSASNDGSNKYSVKFYDGNRLIENKLVKKDTVLDSLPKSEKTSKASGVFEGWYADAEFTQPFDATAPITGNTNVYAKYTELGTSELTVTSFAQMDVEEDILFSVKGEGDISEIKLVPKDGSDHIELVITPVDGGYNISAKDGFNPGSSYELSIPEGMSFVGSNGETLPDTVRTASFSIDKEEVQDIEMSDSTRFVQHSNPATLQEGSTVTVPDATVGDLICFYQTTNPEDRDYSEDAYTDDPETWFKVASVDGDTVTLAELDESDTEKMYDVPDNFPIIGDPDAITGTLTLEADNDGYTLDPTIYGVMLTGDRSITPDLAYAKTRINVGDFVSIYSSVASIESEDDVYFGKVTAYDAVTGKITYTRSSAAEIQDAVDLYVKPALDGDDIVSSEAIDEIEQTVLAQVEESGFAQEAAFMLADLATRTEGFRNMDSLQVVLTDENGKPLSDEEIQLLNLGASFELSDDVELTVEVITKGDQLHFEDKGSVQLAVGIDAQFEVEVEDDSKICIDLSATFVQELAIGLSVTGDLVWKTVALVIPAPLGVKVGATFDLYSYTGIRVDVQAYTVAPEDESLFDQFKDILSNPEKLANVLPGDKFKELKEGLETVGEVFDKIEELEGKIEQAKNDAETAKKYANDLATLWSAVDAMSTDKKYTKDEWKSLGETFGKTNVSADLMEMLNLSTETELDADRYAESLEDLLSKYSEMLEKETDWVTLIDQEIGKFEYNFYGLVLFMQADFLVHADINIAMGANLQYEVGKRYNFWIKIGLFKPEAGSTTMDLIDEQFAFQFYVMGKLGMKVGIKGTAGFAIGSADVAQVGLALEIGPYVKLYGFFIYEYERFRASNTSNWTSDERMAGALYLDFGLYLVASLEAEALGIFEVSYDFVDEEFPLLEAGEMKYPYAFFYQPEEDEIVLIKDEDGNRTTGITMELPSDYRAISYCNLVSGYMGATVFEWDHYNVYCSNPAFSVDNKGVVSVNAPQDARYIECDMVITYKYGKMAFSNYDMQITIPLVWSNLSLDEINQYFTASVRVGNTANGYDIVWSKKVRKNEAFTLPTEEELKELIGYDETIYESFNFPDAGKTISEGIITNTSYDCTVDYTQYEVTVSGIQNADGSTTSRTYYTTYGNAFDFSDLAGTGTDIAGKTYTKFAGVTTDAMVTANKQTNVIDLSQPIRGAVAAKIMSGITAQANYADDSVVVTYEFNGIDVAPVSERIRKGSVSTYDIFSIVAYEGMAVKDISPELGKVSSTTTYYVDCGEIEGESYTIFFEANGGASVENISRVGGSLIGNLPETTRDGFIFGGWYADADLTTEFNERLMPKNDITVYAKWIVKEGTVNFHVNGGNNWTGDEGTKTVYYGQAYGELPVPSRNGYGFAGWYTDTEYTTQITEDTIVDFVGEQTLFAKWHQLVEIEKSFRYKKPDTWPNYSKGVEVEIQPSKWPVAPEGAPELKESDFTFKFMRQGNNTYEDGYPINAGTYDVTITRPADDYYAAFSQTITGVLKIQRNPDRYWDTLEVVVKDVGYTYIDLVLAPGVVDDLHEDAVITYTLRESAGSGNDIIKNTGNSAASKYASEVVRVDGLEPGKTYRVKVDVDNDPNYWGQVTRDHGECGTTLAKPTVNWTAHTWAIPLVNGQYEYTITKPEHLAWISAQVNNGKDFFGYTFKLGNDIDLRGYLWKPIGSKSRSFCGSFDGCGYKISGMYVKETNDYAGLFGQVRHGANNFIRNLTIEDSYIYGNSYVGSIAAWSGGTTLGYITIENCVSNAIIEGSGDQVGGIVGRGIWTSIKSCVNYGDIKGNANVGGILGFVDDSAAFTYANVVDCVNYGDVNGGNGAHFGGIVGCVEVGRITNSANFGSIYAKGDCVGGVTGYHGGNANAKTMNCINYGMVSSASSSYIGAVIGRNTKNKGYVGPVFYDSKKNTIKAAGTEKSSSNSVDHLTVYSFIDANSITVESSLNEWSDFKTFNAHEWTKANDGCGYIPENVFEMLDERK